MVIFQKFGKRLTLYYHKIETLQGFFKKIILLFVLKLFKGNFLNYIIFCSQFWLFIFKDRTQTKGSRFFQLTSRSERLYDPILTSFKSFQIITTILYEALNL